MIEYSRDQREPEERYPARNAQRIVSVCEHSWRDDWDLQGKAYASWLWYRNSFPQANGYGGNEVRIWDVRDD